MKVGASKLPRYPLFDVFDRSMGQTDLVTGSYSACYEWYMLLHMLVRSEFLFIHFLCIFDVFLTIICVGIKPEINKAAGTENIIYYNIPFRVLVSYPVVIRKCRQPWMASTSSISSYMVFHRSSIRTDYCGTLNVTSRLSPLLMRSSLSLMKFLIMRVRYSSACFLTRAPSN